MKNLHLILILLTLQIEQDLIFSIILKYLSNNSVFTPPPLFPKPHKVCNTRLFNWRIQPVYLQLSITLFILQWCLCATVTTPLSLQAVAPAVAGELKISTREQGLMVCQCTMAGNSITSCTDSGLLSAHSAVVVAPRQCRARACYCRVRPSALPTGKPLLLTPPINM